MSHNVFRSSLDSEMQRSSIARVLHRDIDLSIDTDEKQHSFYVTTEDWTMEVVPSFFIILYWKEIERNFERAIWKKLCISTVKELVKP